jgi:immediate early response 3-interacting protein 1
MFTLWTLLEASLLCLNAVCVLHEERFLAKCKFIKFPTNKCSNSSKIYKIFHNLFLVGWGSANIQQQAFEPPTVKTQILNLVRSIRTVVKSKNIEFLISHQIFYHVLYFSSANIFQHFCDRDKNAIWIILSVDNKFLHKKKNFYISLR